MPFCSLTRTRNLVERIAAAGWGFLTSPEQPKTRPPLPYILDNGAWSAFQRGERIDESRFARHLDALGADAVAVVVPDVVCDAQATREATERWLSRVLDAAPTALVAVQNGMTADDVAPLLGPRVGLFVGGDVPWKEATASTWAALAHEHRAWCHVGRVNSVTRMRIMRAADVDSVDGNCVLFQPRHLGALDAAARESRETAAAAVAASLHTSREWRRRQGRLFA